MPIYNVEEFLEDGIQSVLHQTLPQEEIELLLIDDCSTDRSGEIAKQYAQQYENIQYTCLPQNSGMAGKPRNIGIQMAKGTYIMFLDPDDFYLPDACEKMYECIEREKVPFVTSNLKDVDIQGKDLNHIHIDPNRYPSQRISIQDSKLALKVMKHSCPVKIIQREFLRKNGISFLEGVPAEDAYFTSKMFLIAKEAYFQSEPILCYRRRTSGSLSETNQLNERFFYRMIKANQAIYQLFQEYQEEKYYQYYYVDMMIYFLRKLILSTELMIEQKIEILSEMKELIDYWKKADLPMQLESDSYQLLQVMNLETNEEKKVWLIRMEKQFQEEELNTIREMEKKLVVEIEEQMEKKK